MHTKKPPAPKKPAKMAGGGSVWKQGLNKTRTNWAAKSAVNRPKTPRATQFKVG